MGTIPPLLRLLLMLVSGRVHRQQLSVIENLQAETRMPKSIVRMVRQSPRWGYTRIQGALANLGHKPGCGTAANVLKCKGIEPAPEHARRRLLRHRADRRAVATVVVAALLLSTPQWLLVPGVWAPAWIVLTFLACCASHVVVHNHCHCPIFSTTVANCSFNVFASFARGHCASDIYLAHNLNHHPEKGGSGDWITPALGGSGHPALRLIRFVARAAISMPRQRNRLVGKGRHLLPEPFRSSLPREKIFMACAVTFLLWNDWRAACLFALLPWTASLAWLVGVNYVQHEGCDPDSAWAHSRNFTGRFTNWLLFNNGYHTAHHVEPGVHWSETKVLHERIASQVPAHLNEPSATRYMIRRYLLGHST